jgi:hypothetical protein
MTGGMNETDLPAASSPEALDAVFDMARQLTGAYHPEDRRDVLAWLSQVQLTKRRRQGYAAKEKAARDVALEGQRQARAEAREARRAAETAAELARLEQRTARDLQAAERATQALDPTTMTPAAFWRRVRQLEPGPRCRLCRGLGHARWQCRFEPGNNDQPYHDPVVFEPLWKRGMRAHGRSYREDRTVT